MSSNRRDLPWRNRKDPYAIWVSEIMLQQTRVAVVVDRYQAFMARFPSLVSLALASEQDVLALWSGLGYYRRARMLHKAARFVADNYQGNLPETAEELRAFPGIGAYTAACHRQHRPRRAGCRGGRKCRAGALPVGRLGLALPAPVQPLSAARLRNWRRSLLTPTVPATSTRRSWSWAPPSACLAIRSAWCALSPPTARPAASTKLRRGRAC